MGQTGRRYDQEPKLNIKKVFAVILAILVIIMFVYIIKGFFSSNSLVNGSEEIYIEKDTGLYFKTIEEERISEREYEFNKVDDSIFVEPDISQYKLK